MKIANASATSSKILSSRFAVRSDRWAKTPRAVSLGAAFCLLAAAASASPSAQNLLQNPSFEGGLTGWTQISSAAGAVVTYGSPGVASVAVSNHILGGNRLLRDVGGNAVYQQVVPVGSLPPGTNVLASGYFGGAAGDADAGQMTLHFLDDSGAEIAQRSLGFVTAAERNQEQVLMLRKGGFAVPAGTVDIAVRVQFQYNTCCSAEGTADALSLELTQNSLVPPPLPLNAELLVNRGFEQGWSSASPLTLVDAQGWRGVSTKRVIVLPYSNSNPNVPSVAVSTVVSGAARVLSDSDGGGVLMQRLDVRGNQAQIQGGLALAISAFLGGVGSDQDQARIDVSFLDETGAPVGTPVGPLGPVSRATRNSETVLLFRDEEFLIPAGTAYIDASIAFTYSTCCTADGLVDNVSAKLVQPSAPIPLPKNINLVHNSGFEAGSLFGSPLVLTDADGWFGLNSSNVEVVQYGSNSEVPGIPFTIMNNLGGLLLGDLGGNGALRQNFRLQGHEDAIGSGTLVLDFSAWLGGFGNDPDSADVQVRFRTASGSYTGLPGILPAVTAAQRGSQTTLLQRSDTLPVPTNAASIELDVRFQYSSCCTANGMLDGVSLVLRDLGDLGSNYCNATSNSTGFPAAIYATGSTSIASNNLSLHAEPVPNAPFLFFYGSNQTQVVFGDGYLCAANGIVRLGPAGLAVGNRAQRVLDLPLEVGAPGTRYFQCWFRDMAAGGAGFSTSDGLDLTFLP